ncbi:MAG: type II toxin-antitoxin system HicA family toxin [Rhodospirillales bacterium]|nr:type II toxin-antitoxin system HicA family toxin [Rhodospirillales bacterium]
MSRKAKLIDRLTSLPRDFTWDELVQVLGHLGYVERVGGKTGGSRRRFVHDPAPTILLHKPHPGNIVKLYALREVVSLLETEGLL